MSRLNPYYNGKYSMRPHTTMITFNIDVLILIIMENTL